jgi:hypothetical protein
VKKGEQPELSAKWWVGSQPKGLKSATKLEMALKAYENAKKKLESGGDEDAAAFARDVLGGVETAVDAVVAEASKDKKNPEMGFTVDALDKFKKLFGTEHAWIEGHIKVDEGMFSDPEVYHDYLTTGLKRLRSAGQMNFAFVLGKKAEDHRLALHKSKSPKALGSTLANETKLHAFTFGWARPDPDAAMTIRLNLEGRQLPGMKKKGERMLKKFKPQPFQKIILIVDGKEVEDLLDPEDTDVDEPDEPEVQATAPGSQPDEKSQGFASSYDAAALKDELAELVGHLQKLTDAGRKGDLARLASQANAGLNGNNLGAAAAAIEKLRHELDPSVAYDKSRQIWLATRKRVEDEIEKLRAQIAATYQQDDVKAELDRLYRAKVAPVLTSLDESLATTLTQATKETDSTRRNELVDEARSIIRRYQNYVDTDETIPQLDKNPFVQLSIQQTVNTTLLALRGTVR